MISLMQFELAAPLWLLCGTVALLPLAVAWRSRRWHACGWAVALVLVSIALAGPRWQGTREQQSPWLVLCDVSESMGEPPAIPPADVPLRVRYFAERVGSDPRQVGSRMHTNLRAALLAATKPSDPVAGVVLLTDAQHRDDITGAAAQLAATDVPVLVVGVDAAPRDARIASFDAAGKGNATQLTVQLLANIAAARTLTVLRGQTPIYTQAISLIPRRPVKIQLRDAPGGPCTYHAQLTPADELPQNDAMSIRWIPPKRTVTVIGQGETAALWSGFLPKGTAAIEPSAWTDSSPRGVVVLACPADSLSARQRESLRRFVRNGGGLVMLQPGPYNTPADRSDPLNQVAALLPDPLDRDPIDLHILCDASGSMARPIVTGDTEQPLYAMACDAILQLQRHLTDQDRLTVTVFNDSANTIYTADGPTDFGALADRLAAVKPTGPTLIETAFQTPVPPTTATRKAITLVVSDLETEPFNVAQVADAFTKSKRNLAILALDLDGATSDPPLVALATKLGAPLERCRDAHQLGRLLSKLASLSRGPLVTTGKFSIEARGAWRVLHLIPRPQRVVPCTEAAGAQVLAKIGTYPLLAIAPAGLGKTATLTALPNAPPKQWIALLAGVVNQLVDAVKPGQTDHRFSGKFLGDGPMRIEITAMKKGQPTSGLSLEAACVEVADGTVTRHPLQQSGPGRYVASLTGASGGSVVQVQRGGTMIWQGRLPAREQAEVSATGCDYDALRQLVHLTNGTQAGDDWPNRLARRYRSQSLDCRPWVLSLALAIMLLTWRFALVQGKIHERRGL
jgi:hypothetical protein